MSFNTIWNTSKLSGQFQNPLLLFKQTRQIGLIRIIFSSYAQKISGRAKFFRIATLACYKGFWASGCHPAPLRGGTFENVDVVIMNKNIRKIITSPVHFKELNISGFSSAARLPCQSCPHMLLQTGGWK